jgi:2-methylcitrate dehydratase
MAVTHELETDVTLTALADFASGLRFEDLPDDVVHQAIRRIIDTLGCGYGGFHTDTAAISRDLAAEHSGPRMAHILGRGLRSTPEMAAFANAVMIRYLDFNDVNKALRMGGHPSDMIPAILAVADANHVSGRQAIVGVVAAYQGFGSIPVHVKKRGWDQGIMVATGVAMGLSAVLGLDAARTANAISLAVTPNLPLCVTRRGALSMWKNAASAATDRAAIFATELAAKGMTGPAKAFEGTHGLWDQATGPFEAEIDPDRFGYRVSQSDIKAYPSCGSTQAVLWTLLEMSPGLLADDVDAVEVRTHWDTWFETGNEPEKWDPQTHETADHSLPYLMATALRERKVTMASFSDDAIRDPSLRPLMNRITITEDPELTALRPAQTLSDIEIRTHSGEHLFARTGIPRGDHRNPVTDAELEEKFRGMADLVSAPGQSGAVLAALWRMADAADVSDVMATWAGVIDPQAAPPH